MKTVNYQQPVQQDAGQLAIIKPKYIIYEFLHHVFRFFSQENTRQVISNADVCAVADNCVLNCVISSPQKKEAG